MFDKLVVSSMQRRKHTTAKYFFGTGALYILAIACAFATSVLMSEPKLADTSKIITLVGPPLPPALGSPRPVQGPQRPTQGTARPDLYNVQRLDYLMSHQSSATPTVPTFDHVGDGNIASSEGPQGFGSSVGFIGGRETAEPAPRPDPPRPSPSTSIPVVDNRPMRVPSSVLQGKAIERRKPIYPPLAQQIRLQGDVSIEVIIAPDGHVESARIVSGHPMLADKAREAALGWRFQPTLLNNVPVRVTGVIVFVFKLSE